MVALKVNLKTDCSQSLHILPDTKYCIKKIVHTQHMSHVNDFIKDKKENENITLFLHLLKTLHIDKA